MSRSAGSRIRDSLHVVLFQLEGWGGRVFVRFQLDIGNQLLELGCIKILDTANLLRFPLQLGNNRALGLDGTGSNASRFNQTPRPLLGIGQLALILQGDLSQVLALFAGCNGPLPRRYRMLQGKGIIFIQPRSTIAGKNFIDMLHGLRIGFDKLHALFGITIAIRLNHI